MNAIRRKLLWVRLRALRIHIEKKILQEKNLRRRKRYQSGKWILKREQLNLSMRELAIEEPSDYMNLIRMSPHKFEELLNLVEPLIQRMNTRMKEALPARLKLAITLRFLASGEPFRLLSTAFHVPQPSISHFVPEVLSAIHKVLSSYLTVPTSEEEWAEVAEKFNQYWNFPRCCGALDGKHVMIKRPPHTGAEFYCDKGYYSIVMLALVDADYCFLYLDVGANGGADDTAIFENSTLSTALENNLLNLPPDHVILGDDAFPLREYLIKQYPNNTRSIPEKIFNYRLSRARSKVENAFGILVSRFRIFLRPNELKPRTVDKVILAACSLHNWLRKTSTEMYTYITQEDVDHENCDTREIIPGLWRSVTNGLDSVTRVASNNYRREAEEIRRTYANNFCKDGVVPGQWRSIGLNEDYVFDKLLLEVNVDTDLLDVENEDVI